MNELKNDPGSDVLIMKFKEYLKMKNYSKASIDSYFLCTMRFILWMENHLKKRVKEVTKEDILEYNLYLKQKNYKANTLECYVTKVRGFFQWLEDELYILINPCENLMIPKAEQPAPVVLTEKEVNKILEQPNAATKWGIRDRAMLEVLYSTGIRLNELHNLSIFDIDTQSGFLRVTKGKGSKDRFAPLTRAACYWLNQYINHARPYFAKNRPRENALFVGRWGKRINKLIVVRLIKQYAQSAGIKKNVVAHTFRHTFATHMLDNNSDIFTVQKLLGHACIDTTQRYTKVDPKQIKQTHEQLHPREQEKEEE